MSNALEDAAESRMSMSLFYVRFSNWPEQSLTCPRRAFDSHNNLFCFRRAFSRLWQLAKDKFIP
jgi:hypothetical protein